ncbi:MAG: thioredoxin-dependent thiol peroxidase, partial [Pseudohongiellaceae bacterium]
AMTPGCTVQACGLRDSRKPLDKLDAVVLGVSPDPVRRLAKFTERDKLNFTLLSDEEHTVAESYGVWGLKKFMGREYMGVLRTTFIINKQGRIALIMDKVNTRTHHDDVIAFLKSESR